MANVQKNKTDRIIIIIITIRHREETRVCARRTLYYIRMRTKSTVERRGVNNVPTEKPTAVICMHYYYCDNVRTSSVEITSS